MASIGKVVISGVQGPQKTTLALANINLDFSMIKLESPAEFCGLGNSLSKKRKREAEDGSTHRTARKLGLLFADGLPKTPKLGKAYGLRASEIAENRRVNPKSSSRDGPFAEYVGADGTSIWAAATSGKGALALHLLACMLARIWSPAEATSIWSEMVATRKKVLERRIAKDEEYSISTVTGTQIELSRENLREWDASARAWLYTADTAMKLQQTQLMLILENTGLPIESKPDVYENVMSAWMSALVTMNNVVGGVAQNICSGGVLLGLSAWHLYPDMVFLGRETTHVQQNDGLISPGGLTTIGMSHSERLDGVSWSMSLAHLKYYGRPVESRGSIGATSTKVSFDKIVYVAIGSMLSDWGDGTLNITSALRFLVALQNCIPAVTARRQAVYEWHLGWFHLLAQHAKSFLDASLPRQEDLTRFVQLGRRRYTNFLCWPQYRPPPFYGLSGPTSFRRIMRTNAWPAINEYLAPVYTPNGAPGLLNVDSLLRSLDLATVDSSKLESYLFSLVSDRRYVAYFESLQALYIASEAYRGLAEAEISLSIADRPLFSTQFGSMATAHKKGMSNVTGNAGLRRHNERLHGTVRMVWMCVDISPGKNVLSNCESCLNRQTYAVNYNAAAHLRRVHFKSDRVEHRELTTRELMKWTRQVEIRIDDSGTLEKSAIQRVDEKLGKESQHLGITSSGHYTMLFACIALFDTGHVDLSQGDLANVFAISTSNSIYIVELLLRDPCTEPTGHAIRRLVGNIGKPGLCLLVSASDALVREPDLDTSNLIHHSPFDGQLEDNFRGTSLHLHLTGYEQPLATREHGVRDEVVKYYQTIISTYDQGIWAADIDLPVFMASRTGSGTPTTPWHSLPRSCTHSEEDRADFSALPHIVTVDNWHELRDPPITISVVRACGNWLARLALAAVVIQQEMSLIVAPEKLCWACAAAKLKELEISNGYENRPLILC